MPRKGNRQGAAGAAAQGMSRDDQDGFDDVADLDDLELILGLSDAEFEKDFGDDSYAKKLRKKKRRTPATLPTVAADGRPLDSWDFTDAFGRVAHEAASARFAEFLQGVADEMEADDDPAWDVGFELTRIADVGEAWLDAAERAIDDLFARPVLVTPTLILHDNDGNGEIGFASYTPADHAAAFEKFVAVVDRVLASEDEPDVLDAEWRTLPDGPPPLLLDCPPDPGLCAVVYGAEGPLLELKGAADEFATAKDKLHRLLKFAR